ncbi:hypothetical protein H8356DRAFT_1705671 [Neocallimastix lanati (nom. inval.)]|nr:hypothetical protein H8356DRAFT_1705671 [Neocallimastix sp. JGI-2020a]
MKAKYKYNITDDKDFEKNKLNRGKIIHENSLEYSLNILKKEIMTEKILLLSYNKQLINYIINNNIEYCLVYPNLNSRNEYINRMKKRGNSEKFVEEMTNEKAWNSFYFENENDTKPTFKIKLKEGQYLSDIKEVFFK